ncbi:cyclin [Heterostelium album PN500]|uniref:Cyclin n=1 Tax=Heterostelium pallidum (strain ATCC 26659 / Pp 5 / PN500) TaxID=670386 RepID=D3BLA0_HETP5|nr:cyclin [Heterostelium album PN500]EFA77834.1 cyclin [Heterostelium album PN500]|eukprot:XP_020429962.1 cyclin [Heterostelium album PN500]
MYSVSEEIANSPSRKDGIDYEIEDNQRRYGSHIIQEAGILMKLPQVTIVTSQIIFHRFYCRQSFKSYDVKNICMGVVFIAIKYTEVKRRIRDIVNTFNYVFQKTEGAKIEYLDTREELYWKLKADVMEAEMTVLKEFGFLMKVEPPHKFILNYLKLLEKSNDVAQKAWNYLNDSMRTTLSVQYKPESIAAASIFLAAKMLKVRLVEEPYPWWEIFDTTKEEILSISEEINNFYNKPKPFYIDIEKFYAAAAAAAAVVVPTTISSPASTTTTTTSTTPTS